MNDPAGIRIVTPGVSPPEGGMSGTPVAEGGVRDDGGFYMNPWPLSEKYFLVAYSYLKTWPQGPGVLPGPGRGYALYLIDVFGNKELIYRDPAISCFTPIPLRPRPRPPVLPDMTDAGERLRRLHAQRRGVRLQGIAPKQVRYLRISHGCRGPTTNATAASATSPSRSARASTGPRSECSARCRSRPTAARTSACRPTRPSTSSCSTRTTWNCGGCGRSSASSRARRGCVGCHESKAVAPTPKPGLLALLREPSIPAPPPWGVRPMSFLRDVQPVFDRHCVGCHSGLKPAAGLDFSGGLTTGIRFKTLYGGELGLDGHNTAYRTLITKGLVAYSHKSDPAAALSQPLAFGSHRSKLIAALREGPCGKRVTLSSEDWLRLVTWVDANAPYHSHFINMRPEQPPYDLPADASCSARSRPSTRGAVRPATRRRK